VGSLFHQSPTSLTKNTSPGGGGGGGGGWGGGGGGGGGPTKAHRTPTPPPTRNRRGEKKSTEGPGYAAPCVIGKKNRAKLIYKVKVHTPNKKSEKNGPPAKCERWILGREEAVIKHPRPSCEKGEKKEIQSHYYYDGYFKVQQWDTRKRLGNIYKKVTGEDVGEEQKTVTEGGGE